MPVVYEIDHAAIANITKNPNGMVGDHLRKMGRKLVVLAKRDVGVDTGQLRRSLYYKVVLGSSGLMLEVGSNDPIALMHHEGTRPHMIYPQRSRALHFRQGGTMVFARQVRHPGTKANPYLSKHLARVVLTS
jgi:hypothetical protein